MSIGRRGRDCAHINDIAGCKPLDHDMFLPTSFYAIDSLSVTAQYT